MTWSLLIFLRFFVFLDYLVDIGCGGLLFVWLCRWRNLQVGMS